MGSNTQKTTATTFLQINLISNITPSKSWRRQHDNSKYIKDRHKETKNDSYANSNCGILFAFYQGMTPILCLNSRYRIVTLAEGIGKNNRTLPNRKIKSKLLGNNYPKCEPRVKYFSERLSDIYLCK